MARFSINLATMQTSCPRLIKRGCSSSMMKHVGDLKRLLTLSVFVTALLPLASLASPANPAPLRQRLKETHFKITHEAYLKDNWEILVMDAGGANPLNLTQTPTIPRQDGHHRPCLDGEPVRAFMEK